MTAEEQRKAGVTPATLRLSVGIEHIDDIVADLNQALSAAVLNVKVGAEKLSVTTENSSLRPCDETSYI